MAKVLTCKKCGQSVAKGIKVCPRCGSKIKQKHPVLAAILIILAIILIIGAFGGGDDTPKVATQNNTQSTSTTTPVPSEPVKGKDVPFTVGDRVQIGDYYTTLNSVSISNGSKYNKPTEGNVFILCDVTIENESNAEMAVSSLLSCSAYADGYSVQISIFGESESGKPTLDGNVAAGKKMNGIIVYEIPADWSEFEFHFKPSVYSSKEFVFVTTPQDLEG